MAVLFVEENKKRTIHLGPDAPRVKRPVDFRRSRVLSAPTNAADGARQKALRSANASLFFRIVKFCFTARRACRG
jgi:hypothetical protein